MQVAKQQRLPINRRAAGRLFMAPRLHHCTNVHIEAGLL
jgi:hypothetical protein